MPYKPREDYRPFSGRTARPPAKDPCGVTTNKGTPCKWEKEDCPVAWHADRRAGKPEEERCGAPTRSGTPCRWPKASCEYHNVEMRVHTFRTGSYEAETGANEDDSPF